MRTTLCLLLSATVCLADWQDENPYKDDYRRTEAWKMSPSLWTPAAAAYGTYWAKDGRVVLVIDDGQWAARGYTVSTVAAYNAQTVADCVASGGSWSNGACVYPPPPVPPETPDPAPRPVEYFNDLKDNSIWGGAISNGVYFVYPATASPYSRTNDTRLRSSASADANSKSKTLKELKNSAEYTTLINKLAGLDADYFALTNQLSTLDFSKPAWTNKLANILDRLAQCVDGNRDVSKKSVKLVKELAGNQ
jgi:hypothetical protein